MLTAQRIALVSVLGVFIALVTLGFEPILQHGLDGAGAWGLHYFDQMQYLAWVREAGDSLLISNTFDVAGSANDFLHPMFLLSGLVHRLTGLEVTASYLLWLPVALSLTIFAAWRFGARFLAAGWGRVAALAVALLWVPPAPAIAALADRYEHSREWLTIGDELSTPYWTSGYLPGVIAGALLPIVVLGLDPGRGRRSKRVSAGLATLALLISWLHPWQGIVLVGVVTITEGFSFARTRTWRPSTLLLVAPVLLPLAYYALLSRLDPAWRYAHQASHQELLYGEFVVGAILIIGPLAVPALIAYRTPAIAYRTPAPKWRDVALRVWPPLALLLVFLPGPAPSHYLLMLSLPLGILAVQGIATLRMSPAVRAMALAVLVSLLVPGLARLAHRYVVVYDTGFFSLAEAERSAFRSLDRNRTQGAVLASSRRTGSMIPYRTGRLTYTGGVVWTPNFVEREDRVERFFAGRMATRDAVALLTQARARFLFADCGVDTSRLEAQLRHRVTARPFGCVRLFEVRSEAGRLHNSGG